MNNCLPEIRREKIFIPPENASARDQGEIWPVIKKSERSFETRILCKELFQETNHHRSRKFRSCSFLFHCEEGLLEEFRVETFSTKY